MSAVSLSAPTAVAVCKLDQLIPGAGIAARLADAQVALFLLPEADPTVRAIDNHDPKSGANVLSRGIVGDVDGEWVVASPIYKQHFSLEDGRCIEDPEVALRVWDATVRDGVVYLTPRAPLARD